MNRSKNTTPQKRTLFDYFKTPKKKSPVSTQIDSPSPIIASNKVSETADNGDKMTSHTDATNRRIRIYWPNDCEWYSGVVISQQQEKYEVKYDDGEVEWIDSTKEQFEFIKTQSQDSSAPQSLSSPVSSQYRTAEKRISQSPSSFNKKSARVKRIASSDEEEAFIPKDSEESDDSIPMDVESEDEPISALKRRVVLDDSDSDSDEPIAKRMPSSKKLKKAENPLTSYAFSNTPPVTPTKVMHSKPTPTKKSASKQSPSTERSMIDDEAGLEKKTAVILNAGEHLHDHTEWMLDPKDKNGLSPLDPDYDPTSLLVPPAYLKKCTNGMKQWWAEKQKAFDCVLLMKVGKFYETYHMDADIMVKELDLVYMKGEMAHAGFPEAAYSKFSNMLVNKGYRVARVEQTETPQQMKERNARSAVKSQVVRREICSILTPGVAGHGVVDKIYNQKDHRVVCCVVEEKKNLNLHEDELFMNENEIGKKMVEGGVTEAVVIGLCIVDTVLGKFYLGEFIDDDQRTGLRTQILRFEPTEYIIHKKALLPHTIQLLHQECPTAMMTYVDPTSSFDPSCLMKLIKEIDPFHRDDSDDRSLPSLLQSLVDENNHPCEGCGPCLSSLYLCSSYLNRCCVANILMSQKQFYCIDNIDKQKDVLFSILNPSEQSSQLDSFLKKEEQFSDPDRIMILDAITLKNLDILPDPSNPTVSSLFQYVDHTVTPFGKRLLKEWLCQPLLDISAINERLDAVEELIGKPELIQAITASFKSLADIDRLLSRLHDYCTSILHKSHPDNRAQYYEDKKYNSRKIKDFVQLMEAMRVVLNFANSVTETFSSSLLQSIFTVKSIKDISEGQLAFPDMTEILDFFDHSFNHDLALEQGIIMPQPGVEPELDSIKHQLTQTQNDLDSYLEQIRSRFNCQKIDYFGSNKDRFQLQFPESVCQKLGAMPKEFLLKSQRKGYKRFWTPYIQEKFALLQQLEEKKQAALKNVTARVFNRFYSHYQQWAMLVQCASYMDVLHSLAITSTVGDNRGECVRPVFVPRGEGEEAVLEIKDSRHPCVTSTYSQGSFISNSLSLGRSHTLVKIITGPNMGGKSTLLRQIAVNIILAQLGCFVPASSMKLSPVDRIFTRIGAQDRILSNQSTFYVELIETSLILANCTQDSFLIIDELGRGTSTYDGSAIVYAVLKYLSEEKHCRMLFSTHYNFIIQSFLHHPSIDTGYMSYILEKEESSDGEEQDKVTFLYKLVEGVCPESFGINVARLAHIPEKILIRAKEMADVFNIDMNLDTPNVKYYMYKQLLKRLDEMDPDDEDYLNNVKSLLNNVE